MRAARTCPIDARLSTSTRYCTSTTVVAITCGVETGTITVCLARWATLSIGTIARTAIAILRTRAIVCGTKSNTTSILTDLTVRADRATRPTIAGRIECRAVTSTTTLSCRARHATGTAVIGIGLLIDTGAITAD